MRQVNNIWVNQWNQKHVTEEDASICLKCTKAKFFGAVKLEVLNLFSLENERDAPRTGLNIFISLNNLSDNLSVISELFELFLSVFQRSELVAELISIAQLNDNNATSCAKIAYDEKYGGILRIEVDLGSCGMDLGMEITPSIK